MQLASLSKDVQYLENKPMVQVLFETEHIKEIRITMRSGQTMKEHKTPFPIVVEVFSGHIEFGVEGQVHQLEQGDLITLQGNIPHDLKSKADSIVRLSLSKLDKVSRVQQVIEGDPGI